MNCAKNFTDPTVEMNHDYKHRRRV